jgi:1-acyl-sn-glycerol-3-phosphate acyltransferase
MPESEPRPPTRWYKEEVSISTRFRALWRLSTFVVGSWWIVAMGWRALHRPGPGRYLSSGPVVRRWAAFAARRIHLKVATMGSPPLPGSLVVANHIGYVDTLTLGGFVPGVFAGRADMGAWPVLGRMARAGGTIFINRESGRAGARGVREVAAALAAGATVVGFPEGTSMGGGEVLPFRSGLFEAAVTAGAPVVPVAIRYLTLDGVAVDRATLGTIGWFGGEGFLAHVLNLAGHSSVTAEVRFGAPLLPPHGSRRELSAATEQRVRELLGQSPPGCC